MKNKNLLLLPPKTLDSISLNVKKEMGTLVGDELQNEMQANGMPELVKWYGMLKKRHDVIPDIANEVVGKIMDSLPQRYVKVAIENIAINSKGKTPNVKFDTSYELDPIRPYVEFVVKISGKEVASGRVRFEVNSSGTFKDMEIRKKGKKGKKNFRLGTLEASLTISLVGLPFVTMDAPKDLITKEISVDLSRYSIGG